MQAEVPAGSQPLVALALLECFVRYSRCAAPPPYTLMSIPATPLSFTQERSHNCRETIDVLHA